MAPRPSAERPPKGLNAELTHVWDHAIRVMKDQGTWSWELAPLLTEYVYALRAAADAREGFKWLDSLETYVDANAGEMPEIAWTVLRQIAGSLPTQWDRHAKRAAALADQLALTPRGRKAVGLADNDEDAPNDFAQILNFARPA